MKSASHYQKVCVANMNCPRPDLDFEACLVDVGMLEAGSGVKKILCFAMGIDGTGRL